MAELWLVKHEQYHGDLERFSHHLFHSLILTLDTSLAPQICLGVVLSFYLCLSVCLSVCLLVFEFVTLIIFQYLDSFSMLGSEPEGKVLGTWIEILVFKLDLCKWEEAGPMSPKGV